jgi:hypothetical protein
LPTTVAYAGGGGGAKSGPAPADPAPPLNGGGGGGVPSGFVVIGVGVLGSPNCGEVGGGARGSIRGPVFQNSFGYLSYGGGGVPVKSPVADLSTVYGSGVGFNPSTGNGNAGTANTGGGGAGGGTAGPGYNGGNGGSGIVIVRWRQ